MQASKLQYELECVQRPGAEILIDGVPLSPIINGFVFDPNANTIDIITIEEPETETPEEDFVDKEEEPDNLDEPEDELVDSDLLNPAFPPVEIPAGEPEKEVEENKSDFFGKDF